jgi:hypothetical protein
LAPRGSLRARSPRRLRRLAALGSVKRLEQAGCTDGALTALRASSLGRATARTGPRAGGLMDDIGRETARDRRTPSSVVRAGPLRRDHDTLDTALRSERAVGPASVPHRRAQPLRATRPSPRQFWGNAPDPFRASASMDTVARAGFAGTARGMGLPQPLIKSAPTNPPNSSYSSTLNSTRRFFARPSSVSFVSIGLSGPKPSDSRRVRAMPLLFR